MSPWGTAADSEISSNIQGSRVASVRAKERPAVATIIAKPPLVELTPDPNPQKLVQEIQNPQKGSGNTDEAKRNSNASDYGSSLYT